MKIKKKKWTLRTDAKPCLNKFSDRVKMISGLNSIFKFQNLIWDFKWIQTKIQGIEVLGITHVIQTQKLPAQGGFFSLYILWKPGHFLMLPYTRGRIVWNSYKSHEGRKCNLLRPFQTKDQFYNILRLCIIGCLA